MWAKVIAYRLNVLTWKTLLFSVFYEWLMWQLSPFVSSGIF
jgi:hypothetical protein